MNVIEWVLSIENRIGFVTGSDSLHDLRIAAIGYMEAVWYNGGDLWNPFFPGFQRYVEHIYGKVYTTKGWDELITESAADRAEAYKTFYKLLREYMETIDCPE